MKHIYRNSDLLDMYIMKEEALLEAVRWRLPTEAHEAECNELREQVLTRMRKGHREEETI